MFKMAQSSNTKELSKGKDVDMFKIPIKALNISTRNYLSQLLLPEMPLVSSNGLSRDYRGLAELIGFSYNEIQNFKLRNSDPLKDILDTWGIEKEASLGVLLHMIHQMEREDVIEQIKPLFERDANNFLSNEHGKLHQLEEASNNPVETPPKSNSDNPNKFSESSPYHDYYDAYVCYADEDVSFVQKLTEVLERHGIRLFLRERDEVLGVFEYDSFIKLITERCHRVLIILTPEFLNSKQCEYQIRFAASLATDQQRRTLIPLLLRPCEIPFDLKFITKVDFTKPGNIDWIWGRLYRSIKNSSDPITPFTPSPRPCSENTNSSIVYNNNNDSRAISIHTMPPTTEISTSNTKTSQLRSKTFSSFFQKIRSSASSGKNSKNSPNALPSATASPIKYESYRVTDPSYISTSTTISSSKLLDNSTSSALPIQFCQTYVQGETFL